MKSLNWPPSFTIKKHPRARHVKLKTSLQGLELVVPINFNHKNISSILEQNKTWIEKQLLKIQLQSHAIENETLPTHIIFPLLKQQWAINYIESGNKLQIIKRPHQELVLLGNISKKEDCKQLLIAWIKKQARFYLPIALRDVSLQINLSYNQVTIRDQLTRWGSCSASKSINLNYKLLLLEEPLLRHVLIHELCHTVHLDHSDKFWRLVASFDNNWEIHRKALKQAEESLPTWLRKR